MYEIKGKFKKYQQNGINSYRNPQIEILVTDETEVEMKFTPKITKKQNLFIRVVRPKEHEERTKLSTEDEILFRSSKTPAKTVNLTARLTPGRYLAIISTKKKKVKYEFVFSVKKSPGIEYVKLLDDYERHTISGSWKNLHGGISDIPNNPQFLLHTQGEGELKIYTYVRDEVKKNKLFLIVTKAPIPLSRKKSFSEPNEVLGKTLNKAHTWVSTFADLDPSDGPFLITVCSSKPLKFTLTVETESSGRGKIVGLEELKPVEEVEGEEEEEEKSIEDKILFYSSLKEHPNGLERKEDEYLKMFVVSDTHGERFANKFNKWVEENEVIQEYDVFLFCGDATARGHTEDTKIQTNNLKNRLYSLSDQSVSMNLFVEEINNLKYVKHKIIILGNHDGGMYGSGFDSEIVQSWFGDRTDVTVLNNNSYTLNIQDFRETDEKKEIKFFGTTYCKEDMGIWNQVKVDTNILLTHISCKGILDKRKRTAKKIKKVSCQGLKNRVEYLIPYKNLMLHAFGHIHSHGGKYKSSGKGLCYFNAAWKSENIGTHLLFLKLWLLS